MPYLKLLFLITSICTTMTMNNLIDLQTRVMRSNVEANCLSFIMEHDCKKGTFLSQTENGCLTCKGGLGKSFYFSKYK